MPAPHRLALTAALVAPGAVLGQGFSRPAGVPPSVTPAMIRPAAWAPAPFGPAVGARPFAPGYGRPGGHYRGPVLTASYFGGYGYGYASVSGYDPYYPGPFVPASDGSVGVPLVAAPGFIPDGPTADVPVPAELALDFPADATVTVDGVPDINSGMSRVITTRPLKPGETATLAVKATWSTTGQRYEWARTVALGRGERSRLTVVSGAKVK